MIWNNKDTENKKKWVVKEFRPPEYRTLHGTVTKFREFLNSKPDIKTIAEELSGLVDLLLITGNRGYIGEYESGEYQLLDVYQKHIPLYWSIGWRTDKELFVKDIREEMDKRWKEAQKKVQGLPYIYISAEYTFKYQLGFCEEHALLGCFLLIHGGLHPLSKPLLFPYFEEDRHKETRDIYFSVAGAGIGKVRIPIFYSKHAFIVLVKGKEFAESIRTLKSVSPVKSREATYEFLLQHPEYWGENSWIADGWLGYSYPSAKLKEIIVKEFSTLISGVKDVTLGPGDIERHKPFHFGSLFLRVCRDYEISWD